MKNIYYLCSDNRTLNNDLDVHNVKQFKYKTIMSRGSRGMGTAGRKPASSTTKRTRYEEGGKSSNK